jgi:ribokinase
MTGPRGIAVAGSLNMDFVVETERLPSPGETVLGRNFATLPGGKGANQACAAGKLAAGMPVRMLGRVGYDLFADQLRASLAAAGVDVSGVQGTQGVPTGVAIIEVDQAGQNSIVVASGANHAVTAQDCANMKAAFAASRWALFQLELPLAAVRSAMEVARAAGAKTMLDPAPVLTGARELLPLADIVAPNESEALALLGKTGSKVTATEAREVAEAIRKAGAAAVVVKLGEAGCVFTDGARTILSPGFRVTAVDTTAAGDTFAGALAVALSEGKAMPDALRFANAAAALSVTRRGAQASVPARAEVERFLAEAE